ncbi:MAG: SpoIIE family protein phosphatase [Rhodothermales bacterium]|nr:SpoIIE family protein phosphatase [Rhodothermales bacterium]MBO6779472.1 SpoIIE family protein phosphatase [Rhodothermales bacterium]
MAQHSILVVEDEHTLRRLLEYRLSKLYRVRTAANGEEALERVREELPDLVVSDIMMPRMDGFALQAELQKERETRAIPFIFLTAKADEQSRLKGRRTGVDDYITKPFDIDALLTRIERLLERTALFQTQLDARIGQDFSQKLMPKKLPSVEGYASHFFNSPKEHGGGDLFDWTEPEPGTYYITIGDVMGKGLQAKFYAFSFLGYVRSTLHGMLRETRSPALLMQRVNQVLMDDPTMEETFASLLLVRWEPAKHALTYANAGHCRPLIVTPTQAEVVPYSDIILGLDPTAEFTDTTIELKPNSAFVAYTDGLAEQEMSSGTQLGEGGLMDVIPTVFNEQAPIDTLLERILAGSASNEFADDILVFWLQRQAAAQRQTPRWFSPFSDQADRKL